MRSIEVTPFLKFTIKTFPLLRSLLRRGKVLIDAKLPLRRPYNDVRFKNRDRLGISISIVNEVKGGMERSVMEPVAERGIEVEKDIS